MNYERQPDRIYHQSFSLVRKEADLQRFTGLEADIVVRIIHSCGMVDLASDLRFSAGFADAGRRALMEGAPILCDSNMVAAGIIRPALPEGNEVIVTLDHAETGGMAAREGTTRSAAAVDLWTPRLAGSVAVIGNAPTALFRLLEIIDGGGPTPSLVIGFPVGFVGAAESKQRLAAGRPSIEFLTLPGRRGGSAMAAAAVNAIAAGCQPAT